MRSTQLFLLPMVLLFCCLDIYNFSLSLYPSYWCCWDIYCFLYLYVPPIYTVGTYTIFPCFYVPLSFSFGIFQLSFCTYVPLSLFDGISQLSFCAYVPFSLFDGILQLPFLHMSLLFIQSGFITGNNDFPCMFHLLFGRRLHIFQCIRNPKFFPFKYPQRVIWQNFHTFHGF